MKLTLEQQEKVRSNLGLVGKVIEDKVHSIHEGRLYSYDDLFQIGSIGLCKAAASDKGGCFSTYAYRLIWHEICDALIGSTRKLEKETLSEDGIVYEPGLPLDPALEYDSDIYDAIEKASETANAGIAKGIKALLMMNKGYTAREIGEEMGCKPNSITALVSKAKKYLRTNHHMPELVR